MYTAWTFTDRKELLLIAHRASSPDGVVSLVIGDEWLVTEKLSVFCITALVGEIAVVALDSPVSGKF